MFCRNFRIIESVNEAGAFDRLLNHTVDAGGRGHARGFQQSWHDIDDRAELIAKSANIFNARGP